MKQRENKSLCDEIKRRQIGIMKNFTYQSCDGATREFLAKKEKVLAPSLCKFKDSGYDTFPRRRKQRSKNCQYYRMKGVYLEATIAVYNEEKKNSTQAVG